MHEFAIAQALVEQAAAAATRVRAGRVRVLHCRIGRLRQVDPGLLAEALTIAAADTICGGAALRVSTGELMADCASCGTRFAVRDWDWACPACGGEGALRGGGDELQLTSIDVETPDEDRSPAKRVCAE